MAPKGKHSIVEVDTPTPDRTSLSNHATTSATSPENDSNFKKIDPVIDLVTPQKAPAQPCINHALTPAPLVPEHSRAKRKRRASAGEEMLFSTPKSRKLSMSSPVKLMPVGPESFQTPDRPTKALVSPPDGSSPNQLSSGGGVGALIGDFEALGVNEVKGLTLVVQDPSTPSVATSVRAHRSTPPTLAADDFVGGRVFEDSTPGHARFRRLLAISLDNYDYDASDTESEGQTPELGR